MSEKKVSKKLINKMSQSQKAYEYLRGNKCSYGLLWFLNNIDELRAAYNNEIHRFAGIKQS